MSRRHVVPHFQSGIFVGFHYLALAGTFVVDAAEMENAVHNHAQEFARIRLMKRSPLMLSPSQ